MIAVAILVLWICVDIHDYEVDFKKSGQVDCAFEIYSVLVFPRQHKVPFINIIGP